MEKIMEIVRINDMPPDDPLVLKTRMTMKFMVNLFNWFKLMPINIVRELANSSAELVLNNIVPVAFSQDTDQVCVALGKEGDKKTIIVPIEFGKNYGGDAIYTIVEAIRFLSYVRDFHNDKLDEGTIFRAMAYSFELLNVYLKADLISKEQYEIFAKENVPACVKGGWETLNAEYKYEPKPIAKKVVNIFEKFAKSDPSLN
jgi:hypothetical protein